MNFIKAIFFFIIIINFSGTVCQTIKFVSKPELFAPSIVSTEKSEIKITFSADGKLILWGTIGWENGVGGWDIWQSHKKENGWSVPQPVSFNSYDNDFDPCFSADGRFIYFFSNRQGGYGGDDLYFAQFDSSTNSFGEPVNLGPKFNTSGDEWGPSFSMDGKKFIYCSDGFGGKGKHDILICDVTAKGWGTPKNIDAINSAEDDFDPVYLHDSKTIIFTRKISEDEALLYISFLGKDGYSIPMPINNEMNVLGRWNLGTSIDHTDNSYIYYSTRFDDNTKGRLDIYRIKYLTTFINE